MAKKRVRKRRAWNKGLEVGKRDGFTPDQVKRIRSRLADRGVPGLRDLALFSTAIDTMLHGQRRVVTPDEGSTLLKGTGDLQTVRALLGHARIESTARYLGLKTKADPIEVCRAFDI
jgi:hypothetical protein